MSRIDSQAAAGRLVRYFSSPAIHSHYVLDSRAMACPSLVYIQQSSTLLLAYGKSGIGKLT